MKTQELFQYISDHDLLSDTEIVFIQTCLDDIREITPSDKPSVFRKMEKIVNDSEDLSWCIFALKKKQSELQRDYRMVKDPFFMTLVRQNRPSTEAINSEIRTLHKEVYDLEDGLSMVEHILGYLDHIQLSLERYLYLLKDKLKFD